MSFARLRITYVGGPTALIEVGGLRLLTDPTFDPAGGEHQTPSYSLFKLQEPALDKDAIDQIDAVASRSERPKQFDFYWREVRKRNPIRDPITHLV